ncbi:glycosyltransferase family 2 protein [Parafilimonas sp.]|uniref:glycosyltransferase family 2 protein n=1 Tax=Parafilimonas sp. TaxID=1969739 RepID=UPI0039E24CBA
MKRIEENCFPIVSVIIPLFNRKRLISETLQSVINQTYRHWEAVIVDDGSTDGSCELVCSMAYSDPRIRLIKRSRLPEGANTCRNIGIENAHGTYIIFLDSDDLLDKNCFSNRISCFGKFPDADFLVFPMYFFDKDSYKIIGLWNTENEEDDITRFFKVDALWGITGPIYRKSSLIAIGGFREPLPFWQDFDLHVRFLLSGKKYKKFLHSEPDCFIRRQTGDSISSAVPFVANAGVLKKRIDFFEDIIRYVIMNKIQLSYKQRYTLWSALHYFNRCLLYEHHNLAWFNEYYARQKREFKKYRYYPVINYWYDRLMYSQRRLPVKLLGRICAMMLKSLLLDHNIFSHNSILAPFAGVPKAAYSKIGKTVIKPVQV